MNKDKDLNLIARRLKTARLTAHISQSDLGAAIGVSDKSISAYEAGRSTPPFQKMAKIAELTKRPLNYFTEEDDQKANLESKMALVEKELSELRKMLRGE